LVTKSLLALLLLDIWVSNKIYDGRTRENTKVKERLINFSWGLDDGKVFQSQLFTENANI
jgi:hypothetical protein